MKVQVKKVTARIKQVRYINFTISEEEGHDMPETMEAAIHLNNDIKNVPLAYVPDVEEWEVEEQSVSDITFE